MNFASHIHDRLTTGLLRKGATTASKWAETYRRTKDGGPWSLDLFPWCREWHDSPSQWNCLLKGAQLGGTESLISRGMYSNDVLKQDVLYVLPNEKPNASTFSSARFDAAVEASPYLTSIYDRSSVGLKKCGTAVFYIRGGNSRANLKSVPVNFLVLDELDEMNEAHVSLAWERTSGQLQKYIWMLSTPTIDDHGIDKHWKESSQELFSFECPSCSRWTELTFPDCLEIVGDDPTSKLVRDSFLKCRECKQPLNHDTKREWLRNGRWTPTLTDRDKRGFSINQLYSMTVTPGDIAAAFLKGRSSQIDEQEFWNSKIAIPFTPKGAKLSRPQVDALKGSYINGTKPTGDKVVTLGADIGAWIHFEICEWTNTGEGQDINDIHVPKVLYCGKVRSFEELDTFMLEYNVTYGVVDAQPERRSAHQFAQRHHGRVSMCYYGQGVVGKLINEHRSEVGEPLITVDRTSWLDQAIGRITKGRLQLPLDVPFEYVEHLTATARIWTRDHNGNPIGQWVTPGSKADHHAHARCYAEIALALSTNFRQSYDINLEM